MMFRTVGLLALLCCSAVLAGQSQPACDCGDCDCQVIYKWAAITTKSTTYYGSGTNMVVRSTAGNATSTSLSWNIALLKLIPSNSLTVTLEVYKKINECWIQVIQYCDVSFCSSQIQLLHKYMYLVGLKDSQPEIKCPVAASIYKSTNFSPKLSELGDVVAGETWVKYFFKVNGQTIITFDIQVEIDCANN